MSNPRRVGIILIVALVVAASAFAGGANEAAKETGPVTIRFQSMHLSFEPMSTALKTIIANFEKQNPGIKVEQEPTSEAERHTKFVAEMEAGAGPDVISIGPGYIRPYWEAGYLVSLDKLVAGAGGKTFLGQFLDAALVQCTWKGSVFAIPHWGGAEGILLYNKKMFESAGLDPAKPPTTWDEFRQYAKKLTVDTNRDGVIDQYGYAFRSSRQEGTTEILRTWLWANGADILSADEKVATINSPEAVEAFTFLANLALVDKVTPPDFANIPGDQIARLFAEEKVAMYYDGPWAPGGALANNPGIAGKIGLAAPMKKVQQASPSIFVANGITKDSKHQDAAWKFITYLSGHDSNIIYAKASGFQSMRKDVKPEEVTSDPFMIAYASFLKDYGRMIPQVPSKSDIDIIVATALQEILLKTKTVKQALDDAATQINAKLK